MSTRPDRVSRLRGYSLVEILIVIAILALLAGIVFAVGWPAREAARRQTCVSNLRQVAKALRMYIEDYGGQEPVLGQELQYSQLGLPSVASLGAFERTYLKSRKLLKCPSYHGLGIPGDVPIDRVFNTYAWLPVPDNRRPLLFRYSQLVKERGPEAPVATCEEHNASWTISSEPRWHTKRVIVLRLNGAVDQRIVHLWSDYRDW